MRCAMRGCMEVVGCFMYAVRGVVDFCVLCWSYRSSTLESIVLKVSMCSTVEES